MVFGIDIKAPQNKGASQPSMAERTANLSRPLAEEEGGEPGCVSALTLSLFPRAARGQGVFAACEEIGIVVWDVRLVQIER